MSSEDIKERLSKLLGAEKIEPQSNDF
jgi:hypothetical protein